MGIATKATDQLRIRAQQLVNLTGQEIHIYYDDTGNIATFPPDTQHPFGYQSDYVIAAVLDGSGRCPVTHVGNHPGALYVHYDGRSADNVGMYHLLRLTERRQYERVRLCELTY